MKLRTKPGKPKRMTDVAKSTAIMDAADDRIPWTELKRLVEVDLERSGVDEDAAYLTLNTDDYGDSCTLYLHWTEDESLDAFAKRIAAYEKSLAAYERWKTANAKSIAKETAAREESKRKREVAAKEKEIARLQEDLKRLKGEK